METKIVEATYSFRALTEFKDGSIVGPFSPVTTAGELATQLGENLIGVIRISFKENGDYSERIFQEWEPSYTGFDHLIIVFKYWYVFAIDRGLNMSLLAACFGNEEDDIKIKECSIAWAAKISDESLIELMRQAKEPVQELRDDFLNAYVDYKNNGSKNT